MSSVYVLYYSREVRTCHEEIFNNLRLIYELKRRILKNNELFMNVITNRAKI